MEPDAMNTSESGPLRPRDPEAVVEPDEEAVAYHEAAHAVIALRERVKVHAASIVEIDEGAGEVTAQNRPHRRDITHDTSPVTRLWLERHVRALLAGPVIDRMRGVSLERTPFDSRDDEHQVRVLIDTFTGGWGPQTDAYCHLLELQTEKLLRQPVIMAQVDAVAAALLTHKTLSAEQVQAVAAEAYQAFIAPSTAQRPTRP